MYEIIYAMVFFHSWFSNTYVPIEALRKYIKRTETDNSIGKKLWGSNGNLTSHY